MSNNPLQMSYTFKTKGKFRTRQGQTIVNLLKAQQKIQDQNASDIVILSAWIAKAKIIKTHG